MPRPPRSLCLPNLVSNPHARAEYIQSHPPIHSPQPTPSSRRDELPASSPTDVNSRRASAATLASSSSLMTPASTRTSLSVHNAPWTDDLTRTDSGSLPTGGSEGKGWGVTLRLGGREVAGSRPRASWSNAFANTKSWFGGSASPEIKPTTDKRSSQKEIKLSPSMISATSSTASFTPRPVSSPYPSGVDPPILSPTGSSFDSPRSPRVGSGLRYYTERNPAPAHMRVQIPDPIDLQDHDRPQAPLPPIHHVSHTSLLALPTLSYSAKAVPTVPEATVRMLSPPNLDLALLKDAAMVRKENKGPLSPPPTPPIHERESNVPHIRVSSGDDL